ncbi:MAG: hypothetical protein FWE57_06350 [Chitinispirillia bacterium]|nr:hypothetical protein [Chitinispirillia bacterium]
MKSNPASNNKTTYTLTINRSPEIGGVVSPELLSGIQQNNATVDISATPAAGYRFVQWTVTSAEGNTTFSNLGWANPHLREEARVNLNSDVTLTANFERVYTLLIHTAGNGSGSVTRELVYGTNVNETAFAEGTIVILEPVPVTSWPNNSTFSNWSGDCTGTGACAVTMTQNRTVTATFTLVESP